MSRPTFRSLLALLLALGVGLPARAQDDDSPLDTKAAARRLRQVQKAEPQALTRELHEAAHSAFAVRMGRVLAATDTPDVLLEDIRRMLPAELDLARSKAGRLAAWERYWAATRETELATWGRVEAGIKNFTPADYYSARGERLLAEAGLLEAYRDAGRRLSGGLSGSLVDPDPLASGPAARDAFQMTRAAPRESARAAHDAYVAEYQVRVQRLAAATDTPEVMLPILSRRLAAAQASGAGPAELLATLEAVWRMARYCEVLTAERVEFGVRAFTPADMYDVCGHRLEAAVQVAEARRQGGKVRPLVGALQDVSAELDEPLDTKGIAQAKSADARAEPRQLREERRRTLRAAYNVRIQRIRAGTDTPDVTMTVSRRLADVESELAPAGGRAEHLAALERYWERAAEIERLVADRVLAGVKSFTPADYYEARYERLLAELRMARAARE
jgi:hypothetical protein